MGTNKSDIIYRMGGVAIDTGYVRTGLRYGLEQFVELVLWQAMVCLDMAHLSHLPWPKRTSAL